MKITLSCRFCGECEDHFIETDFYSEYTSDVKAACPEHKMIEKFFDSVCAGCVSGNTECKMARHIDQDFEWITPEQVATIRGGSCPFRTNGTFSFDSNGFHPENISSVDSESGKAFCAYIEEQQLSMRDTK